ncbi:MAG: polysaccharide biosynthesis tyrosine autokinase [Candidatus Dactylopiibacterium sp.]|nr:polysaccharide biosynthesis tyrosine autokinase [Candidatus Dactylopiibacterium sp.]
MSAPVPHYLRFAPRADGRPEIASWLASLARWRWPVLAGALAGALAGLLLALHRTPVYEASALLLVTDGQSRILALAEPPARLPVTDAASAPATPGTPRLARAVTAPAHNGEANYVNQLEYLRSYSLGLQVIRKQMLWLQPEFDPATRPRAPLDRLRALVQGETAAPATPEALATATWPAFAERLVVTALPDTRLISVRFRAGDPQLAARMANAVVSTYLDAAHATRLTLESHNRDALERQARDLRGRLETSAGALQRYRERSGIVTLGGSTQTLAAQNIRSIEARLAEARLLRSTREAALQQARGTPVEAYATLPAALASPGFADAQLDVDAVRVRIAELAERYGSEHPLMQQARGEAKEAEARRDQQARTAIAALRRDSEAAAATERALEKELAGARAAVLHLNRTESTLGDYERRARSDRERYDLNRLRTRASAALHEARTDPARVIGPAEAPLRPLGAPTLHFVLGGLLGGFLLAALAAILRERLWLATQDAAEAERQFALPVLAEIPQAATPAGDVLARLESTAPASAFAESIRTLRSAVLLSDVDLPCRLLLVTSSVAGEGKTTVAANLALSLARTGRCLLIDADLRRAGLTNSLAMPRELFGLSDYLERPAAAAQFIHRLEGSELDVLPAGRIVANPLELLESGPLPLLLQALATRYAHIIIDSPPLTPASDALLIAPLCTRTLYVLRARSTLAPLTRRALVRLARVGARPLGLVFNAGEARPLATPAAEDPRTPPPWQAVPDTPAG